MLITISHLFGSGKKKKLLKIFVIFFGDFQSLSRWKIFFVDKNRCSRNVLALSSQMMEARSAITAACVRFSCRTDNSTRNFLFTNFFSRHQPQSFASCGTGETQSKQLSSWSGCLRRYHLWESMEKRLRTPTRINFHYQGLRNASRERSDSD